jgi:hypothetical protein
MPETSTISAPVYAMPRSRPQSDVNQQKDASAAGITMIKTDLFMGIVSLRAHCPAACVGR